MLSSEHEFFAEGQIFHGFVPHVMGTKLEMILCGVDKTAAESLWERMCSLAESLDHAMNRFDPRSEVSRLNSAGGGDLSPAMAEIISICEHYRKTTWGLFDIGRGTIDWSKAITGNTIALEGGNLDFGGVGKGFLLKKYHTMLKKAGIKTAYIDFGGSSILAVGHHPFGNCWKVSVTDPFSGIPVRQLELVDMAMSTSGNQPGYVGHITDPRTGESVNSRRMITVLSKDPLAAEIVSTAAMIADEKELGFLKENNDIATIFGFSTTAYGK